MADGRCGGSRSLNNSGGGLKLKRHWVESPHKQAKSGRIKSVTLLTEPPTASLELLSAQLCWMFNGKVCCHLIWEQFKRRILLYTDLKTRKLFK